MSKSLEELEALAAQGKTEIRPKTFTHFPLKFESPIFPGQNEKRDGKCVHGVENCQLSHDENMDLDFQSNVWWMIILVLAIAGGCAWLTSLTRPF